MSEKRIESPYGGPGKYSNPKMVALMATYCAITKQKMNSLYCYQGSFNVGVKASAGTHDGADCLDFKYEDISCAVMKRIGGFAWNRMPPAFELHVHMGRMFSEDMAWLATKQDQTYRASGMNGLGRLNQKDTSYCPHYRSVFHKSGPTNQKYVATKTTYGYSEAGFVGSQMSDPKLKKYQKTTRGKGWLLYNIAGTVRCQGNDYFVTDSGTFYNTSNFEVYKVPPPKPKPVPPVVCKPGEPPLPAPPKPATSFDATVVTQNVIYKRMPDYKNRVNIMANLMPKATSLVGTQEAGGKDAAALMNAALSKALGGTWTDRLWGDGFDISQGVHANSKYKEIAQGYVSVVPASVGRSHNIIAWRHLQDNMTKIEFFLAVFHGEYRGGLSMDKAREQQLLNGIPKLEAIAGKLPIIWIGDYNSYKEKAYDGTGKAFTKFGYTDVEDTPCRAINPSRDSYNALETTPRLKSRQIDRCFIKTSKVTAKLRMVLVSKPIDGKYVPPFGSDHFGVAFELTVKRV